MSAFNEFIKRIEAYYGEYKPAVKSIVKEYLIKNIPGDQLLTLYALVIKEFSNQFKTPPDVAIFHKYLREGSYEKYFEIKTNLLRIEDKGSVPAEKVNEYFDRIYDKLKEK